MPYYVYVIELDKQILQSKKFRKQNQNLNPKKTCYYVGQSYHPPEERFKQHKQGYKANTFVTKYGIKLHPRKYKKYNPIKTRQQAEQTEQYLTQKLRKKGHGVWSH